MADNLQNKKISTKALFGGNFGEKILKKTISLKPQFKLGALRRIPAAVLKSTPEEGQKGSFFGVIKVLNSILNTLKAQFKFDKKKDDDDRKEEERNKRSKREGALETVKKISSKVVDKIFTPFKSIIDRIWNFIFYTLLGRAFTKLMDWLGDPKNAQKVAVLGRFLKDWWPALLGLYFMPFKGFMLNTLGRIAWFSAKFAARRAIFTPGGAIAALGIGSLIAAGEVTGQRKAAKVEAENKVKAQTGKGIGVQGIGGVGDLGPTTPYGLLQGVASGGFISPNTGIKISGAGPDTQLTALQPGEVVMNRAAVRAVGADKLLALNAIHGGSNANKPKYANNIRGAYNGGVVGFSNGGMVGAKPPKFNLSSVINSRSIPKKRGGGPIATERQSKVPAFMFGGTLGWYDGYNRGGPIKENTGMDIPGATADRQLIAVQPGEYNYIFPKVSVQRGIVPIVNYLVAKLDPNSTPAKLGQRSVNRYMPGPLSKGGRGSIMTLPPITQSSGSKGAASSAGSAVPSFSAVSSSAGSDRTTNASIYGIVG
jgi:hypothetical protein